MTKINRKTESNGYSLGGLHRRFIESIEEESVGFILPSDTEDNKNKRNK